MDSYPPPGQRRGSAIVFDQATQTVSTKKLKRLQDDQVTSKQTAPKWHSHVPIYVDQEDNTKRLAATLDLGKLGWANNMMRLCGKFSHIIVMESSDSHTSELLHTT